MSCRVNAVQLPLTLSTATNRKTSLLMTDKRPPKVPGHIAAVSSFSSLSTSYAPPSHSTVPPPTLPQITPLVIKRPPRSSSNLHPPPDPDRPASAASATPFVPPRADSLPRQLHSAPVITHSYKRVRATPSPENKRTGEKARPEPKSSTTPAPPAPLFINPDQPFVAQASRKQTPLELADESKVAGKNRKTDLAVESNTRVKRSGVEPLIRKWVYEGYADLRYS
ncbi:hypothetical protein A0H81_11791 [Grifola frondosa]|uniref:Uncharacterized protein n=1 Tax=Grifola frondosa TaxID=5627 RepID=A0A1C7LTN1_GRIFR|nr:hypothetical protein A0H81_11791 [Grifola frondosa]